MYTDMDGMFRILMYRNRRGDRPVEEYILSQEPRYRRKIYASLELLSQEGPNLRRPYADVVEGPIRELRIGWGRVEHRILYYFALRETIVLLHAFTKKTQEVPRRDMDMARERMKELIWRMASGEVLP